MRNLDRREFMVAMGAAAMAVHGVAGAEPAAGPARSTAVDAYASMNGFNYNPGYASTLYEMWDRFDAQAWRTELERGKRYFPKMNCIRIWLDMNPYLRDRAGFVRKLGEVLDISAPLGIKVMPTVFNRWHDYSFDYTGVYIDQFLDRNFGRFADYVHDLGTQFKTDERILMWDLCNEPQACDPNNPIHKAELDWLQWTGEQLRAIGVSQPITIGAMTGPFVEAVEPFCDVICFHPYPGWWNDDYAATCDRAVEFAKAKGKPLVANETCQGSIDPQVREKIIRVCLGALKARGIGWCAWQLHGGRMLSANPKITDQNCRPGDTAYMAFIDPEGNLRPGHEAYNDL